MSTEKLLIYSATLLIMGSGCGSEFNYKDSESESIESSRMLSEYTPREFFTWCTSEQSGLKRSRKIDDLQFVLQYKPVEMIACIETRSDTLSRDQYEQYQNNMGGLLSFNLGIYVQDVNAELLKYNLPSYQSYQDRVNYYAFDVQNDMKLVQGKDTIYCSIHHFERIYDISSYCVISMAFDKSKIDLSKAVTFVFEDMIFDKGIIKFSFDPGTLNKLPKLKFV